MQNSNKPIKEHIQDFLDFCEVEKGLRKNTQENYKKYLQKFFYWLDQAQKSSLLKDPCDDNMVPTTLNGRS